MEVRKTGDQEKKNVWRQDKSESKTRASGGKTNRRLRQGLVEIGQNRA